MKFHTVRMWSKRKETTKYLKTFPFSDGHAIMLNSEGELQISVHRRNKLKASMRRK
jgi:hypothetical protein